MLQELIGDRNISCHNSVVRCHFITVYLDTMLTTSQPKNSCHCTKTLPCIKWANPAKNDLSMQFSDLKSEFQIKQMKPDTAWHTLVHKHAKLLVQCDRLCSDRWQKIKQSWQSCGAEEDCGKVSSVSVLDSLCPFHYSLINTVCGRQTRGLRSASTCQNDFAAWARWKMSQLRVVGESVSLFQKHTGFGRAEWSRCSIGSEAGLPGRAAATLPGAAYARTRRLAALPSQEGLAAGWPIDEHIFQEDAGETTKNVHGPGRENKDIRVFTLVQCLCVYSDLIVFSSHPLLVTAVWPKRMTSLCKFGLGRTFHSSHAEKKTFNCNMLIKNHCKTTLNKQRGTEEELIQTNVISQEIRREALGPIAQRGVIMGISSKDEQSSS